MEKEGGQDNSVWDTAGAQSGFMGEKGIQASLQEPCNESLGPCVWVVCECVCKGGVEEKGRNRSRGAMAEKLGQKQIVEGFEC